jgi:hypothetical protein
MGLTVFALGIVGVSFLWGAGVGLVSDYIQKRRATAEAPRHPAV